MRKIFIASSLLSSTALFAQKDATVSFEKWISLKSFGGGHVARWKNSRLCRIAPIGRIILMTVNFGYIVKEKLLFN